MERHEVTFQSGRDACAAWFYPAAVEPDTTVPIVVLAHGLTGTRRDRLGAFAERFAAAGIAALVFDHRGFGDSGGKPDVFSPRRQLADWRAAIASARSLPGVDPEKVVTMGSSMGAGNALVAAARDRRVVACIGQVPFVDILTQDQRRSPGVKARMFVAAARGGTLPAVGQPGDAAFITAPGAEAGWRRIVGIGEDSRWRDQVSARWLLSPPFRPARHAGRLHCPWLVCVGADDRVARPGPAISAARRAPYGELRIYPGVDHFDIYDGDVHEALIADQLEFLGRHVARAMATHS